MERNEKRYLEKLISNYQDKEMTKVDELKALEWDILALGIILMTIGVGIMAPAYLIYSVVNKRLKSKHSAEILELSEELLSLDNNGEDL